MVTPGARPPRQFAGLALFVAILREAPAPLRAAWSAKIAHIAPALMRIAEEFEFVFSDLARLDDPSLQKILARMPEKDWLIAWKLTPLDLRQRLLSNMSERRREEFLAAASKLPKMPKRQVVAVQVQLGKNIRNLLCRGELSMVSKRPDLKQLSEAFRCAKNADASKRNKS